MAEPQPGGDPAPGRAPRVPAHAWAWLQRSRPVLAEVSAQLYGAPPDAGTLDRLRRDHADDPFVRDVVARVVCDVAFGGRVPRRRPPGATWDRGLVWWAAHLAGSTPEGFEARATPPHVEQATLFAEPAAARPQRRASESDRTGGGVARGLAGSPTTGLIDRAAVATALREVLAAGDGEQVPAAALRQLLVQLEG